MDWKEFLKPTYGKIILWWALFLFGPGYSYADNPGNLHPLLGVAVIGTAFIHPSSFDFQFSAYVVLMLSVYYLVSCTIFFTYDKFKSKN